MPPGHSEVVVGSHKLVPGERAILLRIEEASDDGGCMPVAQIMAAGGRDPNRLRDLLISGCCSLCDHPTLRSQDGTPARGVRITDAGRVALSFPPSRRRTASVKG